MRVPAGLGLEYMKANGKAELGVCEMPPSQRLLLYFVLLSFIIIYYLLS